MLEIAYWRFGRPGSFQLMRTSMVRVTPATSSVMRSLRL
jgi:hypothetical protein